MPASLIDSFVFISGGFADDPLTGSNYFGALELEAFQEAGGFAPFLSLDPISPAEEPEFNVDITLPEQVILVADINLPLEIDLDASTYAIRVTEDWTPIYESNVVRFQPQGAEVITDNKLLEVNYTNPIPFDPVNPKPYYSSKAGILNAFAVNFSSQQGTIKQGTEYVFGLDFQLPLTDRPSADPTPLPDKISVNWIDPVTGQNLTNNLANGSLVEGMYRGKRDRFGFARKFSLDEQVTLTVKNSRKFDSITGSTTYSIVYHKHGIDARQAIDEAAFLSSKSFTVNEGEKARVSFDRDELKEFEALGNGRFSLYDWDSGEVVKTISFKNSKTLVGDAGNGKCDAFHGQDFGLRTLPEFKADFGTASFTSRFESLIPGIDSSSEARLMFNSNSESLNTFGGLI